jgi:hypothetical protein
MAEFGRLLLSQLFAAAIGSLIGALLVQLVAPPIIGFRPGYGAAYRASFAGVVAGTSAVFVIALMNGLTSWAQIDLANPSIAVIGLVSAAIVYGRALKHPESGPIGPAKGLLVAAGQGLAALLVLFLSDYLG